MILESYTSTQELGVSLSNLIGEKKKAKQSPSKHEQSSNETRKETNCKSLVMSFSTVLAHLREVILADEWRFLDRVGWAFQVTESP